MIESQVRDYKSLLKRKIDEQGFEESRIEEALGYDDGTVARLLEAESPLTVNDSLQILDVIGVEAEAFFSELYGFQLAS